MLVHEDGEIYMRSPRIALEDGLTSIVQPVILSQMEFEEFVNQPLPFHTLSKNMDDFVLIRFPPHLRLGGRTQFKWQRVQARGIIKIQLIKYNPVPNRTGGTYQKVKAVPPKFKTVKEIHVGVPIIERWTYENLQHQNIPDWIDERILLAANDVNGILYINDFNFPVDSQRNRWHPFNIDDLETPFEINKEQILKFGLDLERGWTFYGFPNSSTNWHCDDYQFCSANHLIAGSTKIWIVIKPEDRASFEEAMEREMNVERPANHCDSRISTFVLLTTTRKLREHGVKYEIIFQNEGEVVLIKSHTYHMVINTGYCVSRAINYIDEDYFTLNLDRCKCSNKKDERCEDPKGGFDRPKAKSVWDDYVKNSTKDYSKLFKEEMKRREEWDLKHGAPSDYTVPHPHSTRSGSPEVSLQHEGVSGDLITAVREEANSSIGSTTATANIPPKLKKLPVSHPNRVKRKRSCSPQRSADQGAKKTRLDEDRPFRCNRCQKTFKKNHELLRHVRRTHNGEESGLCPHCETPIKTNASMTKHLLRCKKRPQEE